MKHYTPKFQEEYSAKLPAQTLLTNLGWSFLTPEQGNAPPSAVLNSLVEKRQ